MASPSKHQSTLPSGTVSRCSEVHVPCGRAVPVRGRCTEERDHGLSDRQISHAPMSLQIIAANVNHSPVSCRQKVSGSAIRLDQACLTSIYAPLHSASEFIKCSKACDHVATAGRARSVVRVSPLQRRPPSRSTMSLKRMAPSRTVSHRRSSAAQNGLQHLKLLNVSIATISGKVGRARSLWHE